MFLPFDQVQSRAHNWGEHTRDDLNSIIEMPDRENQFSELISAASNTHVQLNCFNSTLSHRLLSDPRCASGAAQFAGCLLGLLGGLMSREWLEWGGKWTNCSSFRPAVSLLIRVFKAFRRCLSNVLLKYAFEICFLMRFERNTRGACHNERRCLPIIGK